MNRTIVPLICICMLVLPGGLAAYARGLESTLLGGRIVESAPRNVLIVFVELSNTGPESIECTPAIELPPAWKLVTSPGPFRLDPGGRSVQMVSFYIPEGALAATYDIACLFSSLRDPSVSTHQTVTVRVLPVSGIAVRLMEAPRRVIAGQEYTASFLVLNTSNQEQPVRLVISSSHDIAVRTDAEAFTVGPASSRLVLVTAAAKETASAFTHRVGVAAEVVGREDVNASAQSLVEVIPVGERALDRFVRVPATLRLMQAYHTDSETGTPFQAELEGGGPLDGEGTHNVEFLFRGPDTLEESLFGSRDHYSLRAFSDSYDLIGGDGQYSLSHLTEQYLTARGAGAFMSYQGVTLKGYSARTRWDIPEVSETGAAVGYAVSDRASITLNGLTKETDGESGDDRILTASVGLKPIGPMEILLEGGSGRDGSETDSAYHARVSWSSDIFSSQLSYTYAGPDFPGYYQDEELISMDLAGRLSEALQVIASLERYENDLDPGSDGQQASLDTRIQTGMNYRTGPDTTVTATWQYRSYENRSDTPSFDYATNTLRAGLLRASSDLSFNLFAEGGLKEDRLEHDSVFIYEASTSVYLRPSANQTYGTYLRYAQGQNSETGNDRTLTAGLSCTVMPIRNLELQADGQVDTYPSSDAGNKYSLNASARHTFANLSTLTFKAGRVFSSDSGDGEDETDTILEYAYPFGMPVWKKTDVSAVSGVVRDALTGLPLEGVLLRLDNMSTATDSRGRFQFAAMSPGTGYLTIDASAVGLDRIPTCPSPLPVTVEKGGKEDMEILITKKARLTGRISVFQAASGGTALPYELEGSPGAKAATAPEMKEVSTLANTLVELTGPMGTLRALTDGQGRFRFDEVRPGAWTLKVSTDTLPPYHALDLNNIPVSLAPGEVRDIAIQALPVKRSIRIIEEGGTIIQDKAK